MKVAVTGGAGFIGSHIVDRLVDERAEVHVVDNLSSGSRDYVHARAVFHEMDILDADIMRLFQQENFDYLIHLAAQTMVHKSIEDPALDSRINIDGTIQLLEACRRTGVKRVVFSSTAAAYGNVTALPVAESAPARPTSFYGLSKRTAEKYLALYNELYGVEYVALRYANVYGERQGDFGEGGVISIFTKKIRAGRPVAIFGDGEQTRDFIYVGDVAAANVCALTAKHANAIYNISTQTETSVNALVDLLGEAAGVSPQVRYAQPREGDIYRSCLANRAARENLGWRPLEPLTAGLARTYRFLAAGNAHAR